MTDTEVTVLPAEGLISIRALAKYIGTSDTTLIEGLNRNKIQYIKLSKFHNHWMVRLQDLKPEELEDLIAKDREKGGHDK